MRGNLSAVTQMHMWLSEIHGAKESLNLQEKLEWLVSEMLIPNPNQRISIRRIVGDLFTDGPGSGK